MRNRQIDNYSRNFNMSLSVTDRTNGGGGGISKDIKYLNNIISKLDLKLTSTKNPTPTHLRSFQVHTEHS